MTSTTAGQQQPVMIRGFDVGINPSMLSNVGAGDVHQQQQQYLYQQQQQLLQQQTPFGRQHSRQSSSFSSPSSNAFVIPHVGGGGGRGQQQQTGISTEELVDGLQQSMASMDPAHHHHHHPHQANPYGPRASSTSSNSSSNNGNANANGVSSSSNHHTRPFETARSPSFTWHGYRPGSSGQNSNSYTSDHSLTPNLTRHVSSPSSFLAAAAAQHNPGAAAAASQQHAFFMSSQVSAGTDTPKSPLELFPSPSVHSSTVNPSSITSAAAALNESSSSASGNFYPFASANAGANDHNPEHISNLDGRLSSFHRHQAHAQSNSYSSAFSPSTFLVNGLNSPTSLNPSQAFPQQALSSPHPHANALAHAQAQHQQQKAQTRSPPLYDVSSTDALQQGLNANNKRPGSTDSGHDRGRGNTDSPNEENAKGQSRGRSQGRTPASGKAPSSARNSRSRTRRPSYSRTISPAGAMRANGTGSAASGTGGGTISPNAASSASGAPSNSNTAANASVNGSGLYQASYSTSYAPQLSPYMPGYPLLANGNIDAALAPKPDASVQQQHAYGSSASNLSSAGFGFMRQNEKQAQQASSAAAGSAAQALPQRPGSANTLDILQQQELMNKQRRASDASTYAPSSLGTLGGPSNHDLLNSPAAFTGPLPLPHQAGFRSFGSLPDYLNSLNGVDAGNDQGDGDGETTTRGRAPVEDKRRKRRESHNAVERRRRDNINDRITELASLIPEILLDTGNAGASGGKSVSRSTSRNGRGGDRDVSPEDNRRAGSPTSSSGLPAPVSSNAQFTPAQLAQQAASNRPNKGVVLTKSVEYIRYLQQIVQMQAERNRELEIRVRMLEGTSVAIAPINTPNNQLPPGFAGVVSSNGIVGGNGQLGSPGVPLGGVVRSLPPLEEGESAMDEGTGLSHKRDQFTARRSASRNSMNASEGTTYSANKSITINASGFDSQHNKRTSPPELSPRQDILTTQDWIDNGFAEMNKSTNNNLDGINGHASPPSSMLHDQHQLTFEDLLQVGRNNRVVSESQDSLSSESPLPNVGKMEEDDENALGMQL